MPNETAPSPSLGFTNPMWPPILSTLISLKNCFGVMDFVFLFVSIFFSLLVLENPLSEKIKLERMSKSFLCPPKRCISLFVNHKGIIY